MTPRQSKATTPGNRRLAQLIRDALAASAMSRLQLADASGVPDGTLSGILAGSKPIYAEQLAGIAHALDANVAEWIAAVVEADQSGHVLAADRGELEPFDDEPGDGA